MYYVTIVVEDEFGNISHIRGRSIEPPNVYQCSDQANMVTIDVYVDNYKIESNHKKQGEDDTDEVVPIYKANG